jgi:hypothetical protein
MWAAPDELLFFLFGLLLLKCTGDAEIRDFDFALLP